LDFDILLDLGVALGLGLLVGLQRQWASKSMAGIRTFAMITLFGALCATLDGRQAPGTTGSYWLTAAGIVGVAAMFWLGNTIRITRGKADAGLTTEFAGLVMYLVGALVVHAPLVAVVTGGAVSVILYWKTPMHALVSRMGEQDFRAVTGLILIGMIILPVLPRESYGPYGVLNPFEIWLMVVLIVGISLAGYVAHRLLGDRVGSLLGGVLGGLISSTATTVGYARRSSTQPLASGSAAAVVMIASTVVFARVLLEVAAVAPSLLPTVAPPIVVMMVVMGVVSLVAWLTARSDTAPTQEHAPSDLKAAVVFGLLYAGVLFAVAAVKENFGERAMFFVASLSGLTDMDAITLSSAQLMRNGSIDTSVGWRLIIVGSMANLAFKAVIVAVLGHRRLFGRVAAMFGIGLVSGAALLMFWPA